MKDSQIRALVTGCRDWTDKLAVWCALETVLDDNHDRSVQVVVGDCETGADSLARIWGALIPEVYDANWDLHGKQAGPIRNTKMIESEPDICLAFWDGRVKNSGTFDCFTKAVKAGIPVRIYPK